MIVLWLFGDPSYDAMRSAKYEPADTVRPHKLILFVLKQPINIRTKGKLLCLFMSSEATDEAVEAVAGVAALMKEETLPAGYMLRYSSGSEFLDTVNNLFDDYKEYMTSEGLFFYEE